jgi:tetratricopeptide (TPR) repeat protein
MAASLMYFLVGWIGILRTEGHFFAVEQLRMHAEALLELVNEREPLSTLSADHDKHYRYLKAMLQSELGTCQFSRGNLQEAYNLGLAAVQALSTIPADQNARIIAMKCIFDQIHDLSMGEAPAALLAIHAHLLVQFCNECEANPAEAFRDIAYTFAGEALAMVSRIADYRESPPLQVIAAQLNEIGARDPRPETRAHTRNAIRNQMVDAGEYQAILDNLPEWRLADGGLHNAVILDGLEAVAKLHIGRFDEAIAIIGTIVDLKPYGQHLLIFTHEALKKVAKALHEVIPTSRQDADRLQLALADVLSRYYALGGPSNQES